MKKIIVGITGASGSIIGIKLLETLANLEIETHLVISDFGSENIEIETDYSIDYVKNLASYTYGFKEMSSPIASGTFKTDGMIIAPCSIKTLAEVANSFNENLIVRAADCMLKERRKLVLITREAPLHSGHLEQMIKVSNLGGIILPPVLSFYNSPKTIDDMINHIVGKALDQFNIESEYFNRWNGIKNQLEN